MRSTDPAAKAVSRDAGYLWRTFCRRLTLRTLADYPIVTYIFSFAGRSSLPALFGTSGLSLDVALTARDSDVIKTYLRIGFERSAEKQAKVPRAGIEPAT